MQQILCRKYDVILTDHITKSERLRGVFSIKNVNKTIDKTISTIDKVSAALDKLDGSNIKLFPGTSKKEYDMLIGKGGKKDYSSLLGKKSKKDYSGLI